MAKSVYRRDIDGLRAVAVLSVILYHGKFVLGPYELLPGGYLGVDIFFVISGYLITNIIATEKSESGSFSFLAFYARRIRRIFPMLLLTSMVTLAAGWFLMLPTQLEQLSQSVFSAILFCSNFFFYFSTTNYGAESSLLMPFLHTWSLGVEEQFYIIYPIFLVWLIGSQPKNVSIIITAVVVAGVVAAQELDKINHNFNFFLPMTRMWELLAGAALAMLKSESGLSKSASWKVESISAVGLAMMVIPLFIFDSATRHPGWLTLIPVLGVAILIYFDSDKILVKKALTTKGMVGVGMISYSAYLLHYPIFAFSRIALVDLSFANKVTLILITLCFSILTYFIVEKPFRNPLLIKSRQLSLAISLSSGAILITSILIVKNDGFGQRFNIPPADLEAMEYYRRDYWDDYSLFENKKDELLNGFDSQPGINVYVIGNSWGHDIAATLAVSEKYNVFYQSSSGFCIDFIEPAYPAGHNQHERWKKKCSDNLTRFSSIPENTDLILLSDNIFRVDQYKNKTELEAFEKIYNIITRQYSGPIMIVKGRPTWLADVAAINVSDHFNAVRSSFNSDIQTYLTLDYEYMQSAALYYSNFYSSYAQVFSTSLVYPFCDPGRVCKFYGDNTFYYFDREHLTEEGRAVIYPFLDYSIAQILEE